MIEFYISEEYNVKSDIMLLELLDPNYCLFIKKQDKNIINYYFDSIKIENKEVKTKAISILKPNIPDVVKNLFLKKYNELIFIEEGIFNIIDKTGKFNLISEILQKLNCSVNYKFKLEDISNNKCLKNIQFTIDCKIKSKFLRNTIEKIMKDDIISKYKLKSKHIKKWLNNKYNLLHR